MLRENYNIGRVLGRGSVGVVYEATPIGSSRRVAIKVMHAPIARTDKYRNSFLREVQALAKLHHRSIVEIFDFGELDSEFEDSEGRVIKKGAPYLVMEYIDGEDLNDHLSGISWHAFKFLISELLDALSHAHARNVLHRDLKPQNVVLCRLDSGRFSIKIVDFGLARPDGALNVGDATQRRIEGTPAYMAPELVRGDVRSQGPWTDLYALGCLLWEITTGDLVFPNVDGLDLLYAQTSQEPPQYRPTMPVPAAFEGWLRKLLAKSRFERYEFAPDAAEGFQAFVDDPVVGDQRVSNFRPKETMLDNPPTVVFELGEKPSSATDIEPISSVTSNSKSWTQNLLLRRNIFRHRSIPMVGRYAERDIALEAFEATRDDQRPRVLWVRGEAGVGKSKFGDWFVETIRERGLGWNINVSAEKGINGVLEGMSKFLAIDGLGYKEARERIREWVLALTYSKDVASHESKLFANTFLLPDVDGSTSVFVPTGNKIEVVKRATRRLAWKRPVLFVLNGFNNSPDIRKLISQVLRDPDPLPVLLMVLQDDSVEPDSMLTEYAEQSRRVIPIELQTLTEIEQRELASALVGRNDELVNLAIEQSNGRPVMILKTIEEWFDHGLVSIHDGDVRVSDTDALSLPPSVEVIWESKLDAAESEVGIGLKDDFQQAVEVAAILGRQLIDFEWRAVCNKAEISIESDFLDVLIRHEIFQATDQGWAFSQASIREEILTRAEERQKMWHGLAGQTLAALYPGLPPSRRIAHHFEQAGKPREALPSIWAELRTRYRFGMRDELGDVHGLLRRIASLALLAPHERGLVWVYLADEILREDRDIESDQRLAALGQICEDQGYDDELAMVLVERGNSSRRSGDIDECLARYEGALTALRTSRDTVLVCSTLLHLATAMTQSGRVSQAVECLKKAKELAPEDDFTQIADIWAAIATTQLLTSSWEQAEASAKYALEAAQHAENPKSRAVAAIALGDVYRWISDTTRCEQAYQSAQVWMGQQHRSVRSEFSVKTALSKLIGGKLGEAKALLDSSKDVPLALDVQFVRHIALLCCELQANDQLESSAVEEYLQGDVVHSPDAVWITRRLVQLCAGTLYAAQTSDLHARISKLT